MGSENGDEKFFRNFNKRVDTGENVVYNRQCKERVRYFSCADWGKLMMNGTMDVLL